MSKIKLQNNKVILKNDKVSCSCCGPVDCCMYRAEYFGSLFEFEDLPDTLRDIEGRDYQKVEAPYTITLQQESYDIYYEGPQLEGFEPDPQLIYFIAIPSFNQDAWYIGSILDGDSGPCLMSETGGNASGIAFDDFEDTYTITHATGSGTVSRTSLCQWSGLDNNGCGLQLFYVDDSNATDATGSIAFKWAVVYNNFVQGIGCESSEGAVKQGHQNTPVGPYPSQFGPAATVSET